MIVLVNDMNVKILVRQTFLAPTLMKTLGWPFASTEPMIVILIKLKCCMKGYWYSVVVVELIKGNGLEWKRVSGKGGKAIYLYFIQEKAFTM